MCIHVCADVLYILVRTYNFCVRSKFLTTHFSSAQPLRTTPATRCRPPTGATPRPMRKTTPAEPSVTWTSVFLHPTSLLQKVIRWVHKYPCIIPNPLQSWSEVEVLTKKMAAEKFVLQATWVVFPARGAGVEVSFLRQTLLHPRIHMSPACNDPAVINMQWMWISP